LVWIIFVAFFGCFRARGDKKKTKTKHFTHKKKNEKPVGNFPQKIEDFFYMHCFLLRKGYRVLGRFLAWLVHKCEKTYFFAQKIGQKAAIGNPTQKQPTVEYSS
jgi:hypothetical protein